MKIKLKNKLAKQISFSGLSDSGPGKPNWVDLPEQAQKEFDDSNRYIAFKVPHGQGFIISPKTRIVFEFEQAKINDPNYKGMDTYIFRVVNFDKSTSKSVADGSGDADVEPPASNRP